MNIGILIPGFSASEDDWCIPVYLNLVRELAKEHDVRVFPIRYPPTHTPYTVHGAHVFPFNGGSFTAGWARWSMLWEVERGIKKHHQVKPFDVLHAIWADETGYIANNIGKQLGVPTVISIAGGELVGFENIQYGLQLGRVTARLVHRALHYATMIVAPCQYTANLTRQYMQHYRMAGEEKLHVVPLGVDTELFKPPEIDTRPREFLHVGSLNPIKRQDLLLQLIARMPNTTLDIVGDGELRGYLESLCRELKIEDRVVFHGEVAHDQLPAYYQEAHFLLMTSQHEAFCMAAIEALACGTEVIGSAVGVLPEIGKTAPVGDLEGLLTQLLGRQRMHSDIQRMQRRLVVEHDYTVQKMAQGLVGVYEAAMQVTRW